MEILANRGALAGGLWGLAQAVALVSLVISPARAQVSEPAGLEAAKAVESVLVDVIERAEKSVVAVARVDPQPPQEVLGGEPDLFDTLRREPSQSDPTSPLFVPREYGTGVVIDAAGLILTQYHLVRRGAEHWVTTSDRKIHRASVKGADPRSGLAVLAIEASGLPAMPLGDGARLRKGQIVVALGNPYAIAADGQASASWGIIANLARKAGAFAGRQAGPAQKPTIHHFGTLIQTDARLNLGTSGGALVNLDGQMVGLTTSIAAIHGFEASAGYAIPIDATVRRVIDSLQEGREVEYGLLGVLPDNPRREEVLRGGQGSRVAAVIDATPADWSGLRADDVITHLDGEPILDADSLMLQVGQRPADTQVKLTVRQGSRVKNVQVRLAKYPVDGDKIVTRPNDSWRGLSVDFATAIPSEEFPRYVSQGQIDRLGCVVITGVEDNSPAAKAGLRPRQFISHVDRKQIRSPQEFAAAVTNRPGPLEIRLTLPESEKPRRTIEP